MVKKLRMLVLAALLALVGAACAQDDPALEEGPDAAEELSLEFADAPKTVEGNVAVLDVDVAGLEVVAPDGDDSGETGHLHFFIDKEPVSEGEVIPREAGIVHSAEVPTTLYGLAVGEHEITVVAGDGVHQRIGDVEDTITLEVEGPSVDATAPATLDEGDDLEIELAAEGVEIKAADGDTSGDSGHFHVLVDPTTPPKAGDVVPEAEEGKIYHSAEDTVTVAGLTKGEHVIWVAIGDGTHQAFDPAVMDRLAVTVG